MKEDNVIKGSKSSITYDDLLQKIKNLDSL